MLLLSLIERSLFGPRLYLSGVAKLRLIPDLEFARHNYHVHATIMGFQSNKGG